MFTLHKKSAIFLPSAVVPRWLLRVRKNTCRGADRTEKTLLLFDQTDRLRLFSFFSVRTEKDSLYLQNFFFLKEKVTKRSKNLSGLSMVQILSVFRLMSSLAAYHTADGHKNQRVQSLSP